MRTITCIVIWHEKDEGGDYGGNHIFGEEILENLDQMHQMKVSFVKKISHLVPNEP